MQSNIVSGKLCRYCQDNFAAAAIARWRIPIDNLCKYGIYPAFIGHISIDLHPNAAYFTLQIGGAYGEGK